MGLRFRKSVKLFDGLKINFGKTGASVTVGSGPYKKTYNTNGNVTTTVSLPGTGLFYRKTDRPGEQSSVHSTTARNTGDLDPYSQGVSSANHFSSESPSDTNTAFSRSSALFDDIKNLYQNSDATIEWTELFAGATADDLLMGSSIHQYCTQIAPRILSGDIDAYLDAIEKLRPVDDLALFCGDFEFGTDKPTYIEVEFAAKSEQFLQNGHSDSIIEEFIASISIRVAKDLCALLPISKVLMHVSLNSRTVASVLFIRNQLARTNFRNNSASSVFRSFPCQIVTDFSCQSITDRIKL